MSYGNDYIAKALGRKVAAIDVDENAVVITFADGAELRGLVDGDCCSHTWIEHAEVDGIGGELLTIRDIDAPFPSTPTKTSNYEEEMSYYGGEIRTTKGLTLFEYRNSSNGYYGGSINWEFSEAK